MRDLNTRAGGCKIVSSDDQEAGERSGCDAVPLLERNRGGGSRRFATAGHARECSRKPLVYVSVNVMSFQDHGSRRTARIKEVQGGGLVHC